jgi:hypothetical protein
MRRLWLTIVSLGAAAVLVGPVASAAASTAGVVTSCKVLSVPSSLGATLLGLHRAYERAQPDVHNPTITGPVGRIDLGVCGEERYAVASFNQRYNGVDFGTTDQPERFVQPPGRGWRDVGNTGGDPCGSSPTALLEAWKIVRRCPA